jgi:hypothetical protein
MDFVVVVSISLTSALIFIISVCLFWVLLFLVFLGVWDVVLGH